MKAGMQVFDVHGGIFWDIDFFIGRHLGAIQIGVGVGSHFDARLSLGEPWAIPVLDGSGPANVGNEYVDVNLWLSSPEVHFSGTTLFWSRAGVPANWHLPICTIYYGVR